MKVHDTEITVKKADITLQNTEAIVNAASTDLFMEGGLAQVIKKRGGKIIEEEALKKGPVKVGQAVITSAGRLKAKYVIHASTMAQDFKTDETKIREATASALKIAQKNKISSISFCALGCGVGKFSYKDAAKIMTQEIFKYLREEKKPTLKKIVFVLNNSRAFRIFQKHVLDYLEHLFIKVNQGPFLTVDGIIEYKGGIVLIERHNPPLGWAIPGGFVDYNESVENSVKREVKEETSLDFVDFSQFRVYSEPDRDQRFHTVSVVFKGIGRGTLRASTDAKDAKVFKLDSLPAQLAFDHRKIISDYVKYIEAKSEKC